MNLRTTFLIAAVIPVVCASMAQAWEGPKHNMQAARRAQTYRWHHNYYKTEWGEPVALVVPPTAEHVTNYSWGVPATRVTRIDHQFQRPYPGPYGGGQAFLPTPYYPYDTRQFGVYPVRGPW
jgi:hypothetical protein